MLFLLLLLGVLCPCILCPLLRFTSSSDLCKSACFQKGVPSLCFRKLPCYSECNTKKKKNKSPSLLLSHILLTKFVFLDITVNSVLSVIYLPSGTKRVFLFSEILSRCGVINLLISCHIPACFDIYASCLSVLHGTIAFPKNICNTTFLAERNILIVFAGSIS